MFIGDYDQEIEWQKHLAFTDHQYMYIGLQVNLG